MPVYARYSVSFGMDTLSFLLMVTSTILIAAAGYIVNDYFDIETDRINKPGKQSIDSRITPGTLLATSLLFSVIALILAIRLTLNLKIWIAEALLITALVVAWWYAVLLKKSLLWGNIAVSCMSAGTIAMAWIVESEASKSPAEASEHITRIIIAVSVFALLLSLLREIIKDIEDMEGDKLIKCRSLPIVKGIAFTKSALYIIAVITLILILVTQYLLLQSNKFTAAGWLLCFVQIPLIIFIRNLVKAKIKSDYHTLSTLLKWIMLGGLCTLVAGQF